MLISVNGKNRKDVVERLKNELNVKVVSPVETLEEIPVVNHVVTYYNTVSRLQLDDSVVFDGGVFDSYVQYEDEGLLEFQDSVIAEYIFNMDRIIVLSEGLDENTLKVAKEYAEIFPNKISIE